MATRLIVAWLVLTALGAEEPAPKDPPKASAAIPITAGVERLDSTPLSGWTPAERGEFTALLQTALDDKGGPHRAALDERLTPILEKLEGGGQASRSEGDLLALVAEILDKRAREKAVAPPAAGEGKKDPVQRLVELRLRRGGAPDGVPAAEAAAPRPGGAKPLAEADASARHRYDQLADGISAIAVPGPAKALTSGAFWSGLSHSVREWMDPESKRLERLQAGAAALRPGLEAYVEVQGVSAGHGIEAVLAAARLDDAQRRRELRMPPDVFNLETSFKTLPNGRSKVYLDSLEEVVAQSREDMLAGRVSVPVDADELFRAETGDEARALMRVRGALGRAGLPQSFNGFGVKDVDEALRGVEAGRFSLPPIAPVSYPERLAALQSELDGINASRKARGLPPAEASELKEAWDRLSGLDALVQSAGRAARRALDPLPLPDGFPSAEPARAPQGRPLGRGELDELVRVADSLDLLRGNASGYSLRNIKLTAGLREALGLPKGFAYEPSPAAEREGESPFEKVMRDSTDRRSPLADRIDEAALLPKDLRTKRLFELQRELFGRSMDERTRVEVTAVSDDTALNRFTNEIIPGVGIVPALGGGGEIGERAERHKKEAAKLEARVDRATDTGIEDAADGRHGKAMADLHKMLSTLDRQSRLADHYEGEHRATEMNTAVAIGAAPLAVLGAPAAVSGAYRLGRRAVVAASSRFVETAAARRAQSVISREVGTAASRALAAREAAEGATLWSRAAGKLGWVRAAAPDSAVPALTHARGEAVRLLEERLGKKLGARELAALDEQRDLFRIESMVRAGEPVSLADAKRLARASGGRHDVVFNVTNNIDDIARSKRVWGVTEGSAYGMRVPADSKLAQLGKTMTWGETFEGTVLFQGSAAKVMKPHPIEGLYSGLKRLLGQQKSAFGDIIIEEGFRDGKNIIVTKARMADPALDGVLHAAPGGTKYAAQRLMGRRIVWEGFAGAAVPSAGYLTYTFLKADVPPPPAEK